MVGRNEQAQQHRNRNWQFSYQSVASIKTIIIIRIELVSANYQQPEPLISAANECDTNSDTCCLSINFIVLQYTTSTTVIHAYDN